MTRDQIEDVWDEEPTRPFEWLRTARVLVGEDDDTLRDMVATRLRRDGSQVVEARSGDEALDIITQIDAGTAAMRELDLVVLDVRMPGLSGIEVIRLLRSWHWTTPAVLVTAYPDTAIYEQALALGASVLPKPFILSKLSRVASETLSRRAS